MWKWFGFGIVATLVVLSAAAYVYFEQGFVDTRANIPMGMADSWLGTAMDASTERHAPKVNNPIAPTEANLVAGAQLYRDKCAGCHGSPINQDSDFGRSFYPHVPQFFGHDAPDMPENQNFYIIKNGVRFTAMPAWGNVMADSEIWQVTDLLANLKRLPAPVEDELKKPSPAPAP